MIYVASAILVGLAWLTGYSMGYLDGRRSEEPKPKPVQTVLLPDAVGVPTRHRRKAALVLAGIR